MVPTGELDELAPPGSGPREPNGRHGRFGSRIDEAEHLDRRHPVRNKRRQSHFALGWSTEGPAALQLRAYRLADGRRAVTQDQWAPGADEIEIAVPIDIPEPWTFSPGNEGWRSPDRAIRADRAVDAAGDQALRLLEQRRRSIDAYDSSRSRSRSKALLITEASSAGSGLSRSARIGPCRKLAVKASASFRKASRVCPSLAGTRARVRSSTPSRRPSTRFT